MFEVKHVVNYGDKECIHYVVVACEATVAEYRERMARNLPDGGIVTEVTVTEARHCLLVGAKYKMKNGANIIITLQGDNKGTMYAGQKINGKGQPIGTVMWWYCNGRHSVPTQVANSQLDLEVLDD